MQRFVAPALVFLLSFSVAAPGIASDKEPRFEHHFSGYLKSVDFISQTTGLTPTLLYNPLLPASRDKTVVSTLERLRLKSHAIFRIKEGQRFVSHIEYDNQPQFGNYVNTGDFKVIQQQMENRQFLDLSQTLVTGHSAYYEQLLYRAVASYESRYGSVDAGRQLITWGKGFFFTPTQNLFNPFYPTQIEIFDRRPGVDGVRAETARYKTFKLEGLYCPPGRSLSPQRLYGRLSGDVGGWEVSALGGRIFQQEADFGFDFAGNVKQSVLRGELLFRKPDHGAPFTQAVINADYNFPRNIHALLEYYYNGQGGCSPSHYQFAPFIRGETQQLAQQYLGLSLGKNITPLLSVGNNTIMNLNDASLFIRPEVQYSVKNNLVLTAGMEIFAGGPRSEYGRARNIYYSELKYSF